MNDIRVKEASSPYIFSFPHSGQMLTREMEFQLTPEAFKFLPNVDWHLEELYGFLEKYKVNIISTPHSRYVVDINRPHELDVWKAPRLDSNLFYETSFRLEKVMEKIGVEKREQEKVRMVVENSHILYKRVKRANNDKESSSNRWNTRQ